MTVNDKNHKKNGIRMIEGREQMRRRKKSDTREWRKVAEKKITIRMIMEREDGEEEGKQDEDVTHEKQHREQDKTGRETKVNRQRLMAEKRNKNKRGKNTRQNGFA